MFISISEFIGHLHPALVHLPIGILLVSCLFLILSRKDKSQSWQKAIQITLGLGMISAIFTCITGYILSQSGDYEEGLVNNHQWFGISVAIVSVLIYYFGKNKQFQQWRISPAFILLTLIMVTGHLGGSLTHGSDYLTKPFENLSVGDSVYKRKPIANIQDAFVYGDIIKPLFEEKCYSCHGPNKQKGKLRLDQQDMMMKGGKDGVVILPDKSAESELVKRIQLPLEDEHHMSPKEKHQLTEKEKMLIRWWIDQGAEFSKKVKDITTPENIKPALLALQNNVPEKHDPEDIPVQPVERADEISITKIRNLGALVIPVSQNSNYLEASFILATGLRDNDLSGLLSLRNQLVWLRLSSTPITDSSLAFIGQCNNLIRLQLDHTNISDRGMENLKSLKQLRVLNLVGTHITSAGLLLLKELKNLHSIYLYQTNIEKKDWALLKRNFPKTMLDSGGYSIPFLKEDTVIVKPPPIQR